MDNGSAQPEDTRMPTRLNPFVDSLAFPAIPAVQAWAREYDGARGPLLDLSQAVPGYPPPPEMLRWLGEAAASTGATGYGNIEGEDVLREAYAAHVAGLYGAPVGAAETHVTSGCNQAFVAASMAVAGAGDAVVMTTPCYFNHESTLSMLGIGTRFVACAPEDGFLPELDAVRAAITPEVRAFALVSPNNPTGCIYPPALLDAIFELCRAAGIWLILDETYRDFAGEADRHGLLSRPDWREGLIQIYSFSKSLCIPGHRLGAVVAGERVVGAIAKVMDNLQICAPRAAQIAVARAIEPLTDWRAANRVEIGRRAVALRRTLAAAPEWRIGAMGAYFAYLRHPFAGHGSVGVARRLAREAGVSCLPGAFFGAGQDDYLRLAFANADSDRIADLGSRLALLTPEGPRP